MPTSPRNRLRSRSSTGVVVALVVAVVAFAYQQTAVLPVIPEIERELGVPVTWGAWLLTGYLLVATVSTPLIGRLADRYGRRRMLLLGLSVFLAGSVGAAASPTFPALVASRALQGVGGAVFPLALSIVRQELPSDRVGAVTGRITGAFGVGTALGFATSGALVTALSWRWVFVAGAVVVGVAIPLVLGWVPSRTPESTDGGGIDLPGAALLGAALGALLVALTLWPQSHGMAWAVPGALLVVAAGAGAVWLRREHRTPHPLIDLHVLREPVQLWTNGVTLAIGYGLFGTFYLVPQFVTDPVHGFGAGTVVVGLYLVPAAIGQLAAGPAVGPLQRGGSARRPLVLGLLAMGVALAGFAASDAAASAPGFLVSALVLGCGAGLTIGASSTLVVLGAGPEHAAVATALNSTARRVGGGIGSQVSAAVLAFAGRGGASWSAAFGIGAALCLLAVPACARLRARPTGPHEPAAAGEGRHTADEIDRSW